MTKVELQTTTALLNDISKNSGHIILDCGPYYVQLIKEADSLNISFEAVSHNFNHLVPKTIQAQLEEYGFNLIKKIITSIFQHYY